MVLNALKILFVCLAVYSGAIIAVLATNPSLWVDVVFTIGNEVVMAIPNYVMFVAHACVERFKTQVVAHLINFVRWLVGLSPIESKWYVQWSSQSTKPKALPYAETALLLPPIASASLLIAFGGAWAICMAKVWRLFF